MTQKQHFYFFTSIFLIFSFLFFISAISEAQAKVCINLSHTLPPVVTECAIECSVISETDTCSSALSEDPGRTLCPPSCPDTTPPPATTTASTSTSSTSSSSVTLPNPLGTTDIRIVIGRIIQLLMSAIGSIALMILIYGGFQWLTSMGNPEKIKKGRDIMLWTLLGVIIMFSAYFIVRFIINTLVFGTEVVPPAP